jgi:hypothetical protein
VNKYPAIYQTCINVRRGTLAQCAYSCTPLRCKHSTVRLRARVARCNSQFYFRSAHRAAGKGAAHCRLRFSSCSAQINSCEGLSRNGARAPCVHVRNVPSSVLPNSTVRNQLYGLQIYLTTCSNHKKLFKITFLNRIPVLRYRGYRYPGTFIRTLYTYQLVL